MRILEKIIKNGVKRSLIILFIKIRNIIFGKYRRYFIMGKAKEALKNIDILLSTPKFNEITSLEIIRKCLDLSIQDEKFFKKVLFGLESYGGTLVGGYDVFDQRVLYGLIKYLGIKTVFECAPCKGLSTAVIQRALPENCEHISFDINNNSADIVKNIRKYSGKLKNWKFELGDFRNTVKKYREEFKKIDFLFIDADHSCEFAKWYLDESGILEAMRPGSIIHIHDIYPLDKEPKAKWFVKNGESKYFNQWVFENKHKYEILYTYELSRQREITSSYDKNLFYNSEGYLANNPTVYLRKINL